jgi:hypothetical protein
MDMVVGRARPCRVEDGQAQPARDLLDQPAAIDVERVFEAALHQQHAEIGGGEPEQQRHAPRRQGVVDDPSLQLQRHRGQERDERREDAEDDLHAAAVLPDIGVECRRHIFPAPPAMRRDVAALSANFTDP